MYKQFSLLLVIVFVYISCSSSTTNENRISRDRNLISLEEIRATDAIHAYNLISKLRPFWLRGRGQRSLKITEASYPQVYVNGRRYGQIESLRGISVANIFEIKFMSSIDATTVYGMDHSGGAILVTISR